MFLKNTYKRSNALLSRKEIKLWTEEEDQTLAPYQEREEYLTEYVEAPETFVEEPENLLIEFEHAVQDGERRFSVFSFDDVDSAS